jgi:hypothetical protein
MRLLKARYAQSHNDRYRRVGHRFQGRFDARVVRDDEHLAEACRYIWNNPVALGLCDRSDTWPWSGGFGQPRACTGASAGAHEHSGETSPPRPFSSR